MDGATIDISDLEAKNAELEYRIQHPAPVLTTDVVEGVLSLIKKQFESQGAYAGDPWEPLSTETVLRKARQGFPDLILVETGSMEDRMTGSIESLGVTMLNDNTVSIGTADPVGFFHQGGTINMPARPIVPAAERIPATDVDVWTEFVAAYIFGGEVP